MILDPVIIRKGVHYIEKHRGTETKETLKTRLECSEIVEKCPNLFDLVYDNEYPYKDMLEQFFKGMEHLLVNPNDREKQEQKIGLNLAKEYIYPLIDMDKEVECLEEKYKLQKN